MGRSVTGWHWQLDKRYDPDQPRIPSGQTGGGRWASIVAGGPLAFVVKNQLEEANLPETHMDGIGQITFTEGDYIKHAWGDAYGTYDPATGTINLAANAPDGGNISVYGGATVLHEIGHNVHMRRLTDEAAREWDAVSRNGQSARISAYARTNGGEHFAECYRAYARGGDYRKRLRNMESEAYKFMQPLFSSRGSKKFLPLGEKPSNGEQWWRYDRTIP